MSIQVKNIRKQFGDFTALKDVSLDFPTGELVALHIYAAPPPLSCIGPVMLVRVRPGATALARIPALAQVIAMVFVSWTIAALDAP